MILPKNNPTDFCKAFIERELKDCKESNIWMSYWPIMNRMIERASELNSVYSEIISQYGYSDKENCAYVWLILEHIWTSVDYAKIEIEKARGELKEINQLSEEIETLASRLSTALARQNELFECTGFNKPSYQTALGMVGDASEHNYLYKSHVSDKIRRLEYQYDLKYWPSRSDLVQSIADFEAEQPAPIHDEYPESVLKGRSSDIKDFVIAFDAAFDELNGLPTRFRFSNNAMADIINVILDLPFEKLTTGEAIRVVRNRQRKKTISTVLS
ncbi:hypothetical protein GNP89_03950 [Aliivibrio fischeri]|uniref:hypothetical protein n=1 Tax=Aliivibrio fischeri TaxID=668 RepID=UPI0012D93E4F|nr:hypothetical protein [Aliivibrio fischeri]MUL01364.1 hypothetical protein [Aliivibrio fischeri]